MFEQTFKNIDDTFHKEAGCTTEQTSWIPFLKYLDDLEQEKGLIDYVDSEPFLYLKGFKQMLDCESEKQVIVGTDK